MFLKPFRTKSNTQIKGSDRKKLRSQLQAAFPSLTTEACSELVPSKDEFSVSRLVTHAGQSVICYLAAKQPVLLEVDGRLLPTVYTLWRQPDLLPCFTTYAPVLSKLRGGADLMLPGVIVGDPTRGLRTFGRLEKGDPVAVNLDSNRAPVAVGHAARSSEDLYMAAGRGKAVIIVHVLGDLLWELGGRQKPPELGPPLITKPKDETAAQEPSRGDSEDEGEDSDGDEEGSDDVEELTEDAEKLTLSDSGDLDGSGDLVADAHSRVDVDVVWEADAGGGVADAPVVPSLEQPVEERSKPEEPKAVNMDDVLYDTFRQAWKTSAKKLELPVLVSTFYAQHMQPNSTHPLDVKKSSYKKLSKFLERMEEMGLVQVKELSKGVQSIVSVQLEHPEIRGYRVQSVVPAPDPDPDPAPTQNQRVSRQIERIEELFLVSGNVAPLFRELGVNKGTPLSAQEVRKYLTQYVKNKKLHNPDDKSQVKMDTVLATCVTGRADSADTYMRWDELNQKCLNRMSPGHIVAFKDEPPQVKKGQMPCVELLTATRSGNKKVTMVLNLPVFGVNPHEFAHRCQVGVAASTSVGDAPNRPPGTVQVQVQGNQIRFIAKLLQDDYKVPKKYIKGLEKAPKK